MTHEYDDIINLPHPTSSRHPRMPMYDRAAQFAPFAALTGHSEAMQETARKTNERIELCESDCEKLNRKVLYILSHINEHPKVSFTYFKEDGLKEGGEYLTKTGNIKKWDDYKRLFILEDQTSICLKDIIHIIINI